MFAQPVPRHEDHRIEPGHWWHDASALIHHRPWCAQAGAKIRAGSLSDEDKLIVPRTAVEPQVEQCEAAIAIEPNDRFGLGDLEWRTTEPVEPVVEPRQTLGARGGRSAQ